VVFLPIQVLPGFPAFIVEVVMFFELSMWVFLAILLSLGLLLTLDAIRRAIVERRNRNNALHA